MKKEGKTKYVYNKDIFSSLVESFNIYYRKNQMWSNLNPKLNVRFRSLGLYSTDSRKSELFVTEE